MNAIDLRSDTVTLPSPAMRRAVFEAELGDDVFGEDPTVNAIEKTAAETMGKQAALLVASGTMGNLASVLTHCGRGDEVILGDQSHTFFYEAGGIAALGGIHPRTLPNQPDGTIDLERIEAAIRPHDVHFPPTRLICLENTHNRCGGVVLTPEYTDAVRRLADKHDLAVHLDGARIFNAAVALDLDVRQLTAGVDSLSFCLSKGLAAPVGSVICGSHEFIDKARHIRKMLGGGMRQAGILAAAGIVALNDMTRQIEQDHANARRLAEGIAAVDGLHIDPQAVQTNLVYFELADERSDAQTLADKLEALGVRVLASGRRELRAVTHYGVTPGDIDAALDVMRTAVKDL